MRPRKGAWRFFVLDGAGADRDGTANGRTLIESAQMRRFVGDDESPGKSRQHDVVVDSTDMSVSAPFGLQIATPTASSGILANPERLQFTGHERDTAKVDYMHARYYAPGAGRFLAVDPFLDVNAALANTQRWNRYSYVSNNPIKEIDPDGRDEWATMQKQLGHKDDWNRDKQQIREILSIDVSAIPVVGDAYDAISAITGRDLLTGTKIGILGEWPGCCWSRTIGHGSYNGRRSTSAIAIERSSPFRLQR